LESFSVGGSTPGKTQENTTALGPRESTRWSLLCLAPALCDDI
jgi:hypothetical protein